MSKVHGKATNSFEMLDRNYLVVGWELVDGGAVRLAKAMVRNAKKEGGKYSRKLVWFWGAGKDAGWDEDEIAWWILDGSWHKLTMGTDLREVF